MIFARAMKSSFVENLLLVFFVDTKAAVYVTCWIPEFLSLQCKFLKTYKTWKHNCEDKCRSWLGFQNLRGFCPCGFDINQVKFKKQFSQKVNDLDNFSAPIEARRPSINQSQLFALHLQDLWKFEVMNHRKLVKFSRALIDSIDR